MKFIDLNKPYQLHKQAIDQAIHAVLDHGQYIRGPELERLEQKLAEHTGSKHCISCSSGTTALQIAMMALNIGPGDEVITTPFSFFATGEAIALLGAKPVFVDIEPKTFNLDPILIEAAITEKTKAIIAVNLYGQCADFDVINAIANKHNMAVIEDAAQSLGAKYKDKHSCNLSTIACTSFFPSKPLGCYGDGGACFTNDSGLAERMSMIANHGERKRYTHEIIGINGRFDTIQAAVLLAKLPFFQTEIERRQQVAGWYAKYLNNDVVKPYVEPFNLSVYAQYTIRVKNRDPVCALLREANIPTAVHYPVPMQKQPCFANMECAKQVFPLTDCASNEVLSLPFHPYMEESDVKQIADTINKIMAKKQAVVLHK